MTVHAWDEMQLRFDLPGLDEVEEDATLREISPEQARMISEAARKAWETLTPDPSPEGRGEKAAWFEDYMLLIQQGWPWRVAAYIAWAGTPKIGRWPRTLQELATQVLGLTSERVVYTWRRKYPTIDTVVSQMLSKPLFEARPDVFQALIENASSPDYKTFNDRKLFLEITGDYVPKSKLQLSGMARDLSELSDDELDRLAGLMGTTEETNEKEGED